MAHVESFAQTLDRDTLCCRRSLQDREELGSKVHQGHGAMWVALPPQAVT